MSETTETKLTGTGEVGLAEKLRVKTEAEEHARREAEKLHNATAEVRDRLEARVRGQFDGDPVAKVAFDAARAEQKQTE
jgi:hypothetical protein